MSTIPLARRGGLPARAKFALFAFIGAMLAYVLYHNESFLLDPANPVWEHYAGIKWTLLPHGIAGATALSLAFAQFSSRLRARHLNVHRWLGRVYVTAVVVAAPLGVATQYLDERTGDPRSFTVLAAVDAALWLLATGVAFWCIRQRRVDQHRQWMTRSFAMALVFLEGRLILGVTGWDDQGAAIAETVIWCCIALAYPLADLALLVDERLRARAVGRPSAPVAENAAE
jgi:uncharacterized membrane protein YozB (DUF420 family)